MRDHFSAFTTRYLIVCFKVKLQRINSVVPDVEVGEAPGVVHEVGGGEDQGELDGIITTSPKHCENYGELLCPYSLLSATTTIHT